MFPIMAYVNLAFSYLHKVCTVLFLAFAASYSIAASTLSLDDLPRGSLGKYVEIYTEAEQLSLQQVLHKYENNAFVAGTESVINRGIGSAPIWVHLRIENPADKVVSLKLFAGLTWIDKLDLYLVQDGRAYAHQQSGDDRPHPPGLTPNVGFIFPVDFNRGVTDLYLRVESIDPLVLPIELITYAQAESKTIWLNYIYGFIYGFLISLIAYNTMLYLGLGERSYLYYSMYLSSLIILNLAYTGQGQAWIWAGHPEWQRYIILVLMVVFALFGFLFASVFLALKEHAARAWRFAKIFQLCAVVLMGLAILMGSQLMAALLAFGSIFIFTLWIVWFAVLTVKHGRVAGRYFLAAALCSMAGIAITTLAVWGKIPFNDLSYHSLELGVIAEAILLALALAYQMRFQQQARMQAENQASQKERELIDTSGLMAAIVDHAPDAILIVDADGIIISCNRATERIFSVTTTQMVGYQVRKFILLTEKNNALDASGLQEGVATRGNGESFPCDMSTADFQLSGHQRRLIILHDISERKKMEKAKSEFVSTVRHELRTPLTAIRGALGLMRGGVTGALPKTTVDLLEIAYKNTEVLTRLINDMLDIQKIEAGQLTLDLMPLPLNRLLDNSVKSNHDFGAQLGVAIAVDEAIPDVHLRVDEGRFQQIMGNLLSNACKFSPVNSRVDVRATEVTASHIKIEIRDQGSGIPLEFRDKIFQRFTQADSSDTRKIGGTGLGLAITRDLVSLMHGEIDYESIPGKGTTFSLIFPIAPNA